MRIINVEQRTPEWLEARKGKVTSTRAKDLIVLRGKGKKMGFYELIAERVATDSDGENPMDRGLRLEEEAMEMFTQTTGYKVDTSVGFAVRDDNPNIALSPDGLIRDDKGVFTAGVELKCLSSARHIQNIIENQVPSDYVAQIYQYFIVAEVETVYFVSYDPRVVSRPIHIIEVNRDDVEDQIEFCHNYQVNALEEVDQWVEKLIF